MINTAGESAANSVSRTLNELQDTAAKAIEKSKDTATTTVNEMMETHNMLRTDTTALFERLREANIMLQEVLSGSHENMSALENTLMLRVSEFVAAMHEVTGTTTDATDRVETTISNFREITTHVVTDLGQLAGQFEAHGRDLGLAAELIERSNQRTEDAVGERRVQLDSLVATLDIRTEDIEQRLKRFSGLLDESLEAASNRAREVARLVSESSADGTRAISEQFERVRENAELERNRTVETMRTVYAETSSEADRLFRDANERFVDAAQGMRSIYEQSAGDTTALFRDAGQRFAETVQDMKQMAAEMQRELEATRTELRRGVFELPQETAESAAQMRRVIVDQIEALAELNRIVARHGRNLDAVEPVQQPRRLREEPTLAVIGGRNELPPRVETRAAAPPRSAASGSRQFRARRTSYRSAVAVAVAGATECRPRLAVRSADPRLARGERAGPRIPRARSRARDGRTHAAPLDRVAGLFVGRYCAHDRPRCRRRPVGSLQARRTQRVHAQALYLAGPAGVRRDPQEVSRRPRIQADR